MNMRRRVRLTESDLHRIVKESVKRVLREWEELPQDEMDKLNLSKETSFFHNYGEECGDDGQKHDKEQNAPTKISIDVLKPFVLHTLGYNTSTSGEKKAVLPNQTIELTKIEQEKGFWFSDIVTYRGRAKCAHIQTFYAHGRPTEEYEGVGFSTIDFCNYEGLLQGQERGFIKINWEK